jgi:hypothetical protein
VTTDLRPPTTDSIASTRAVINSNMRWAKQLRLAIEVMAVHTTITSVTA